MPKVEPGTPLIVRNPRADGRRIFVDVNQHQHMSAEPKTPSSLELSQGYRSARRLSTVLCAITIAWSSAQVELRTLKLEFAGELDLNAAFIPLLLLASLLYVCARGAVEFAMQAIEVRRWGYAQIDLKISVGLMQFALLALASTGFERSPRAIGLILSFAGLSFLAALASIFCLMVIFVVISVHRSKRQGRRRGIAAVVGESIFLATYVSVLALAVTPIVLAIGFHAYSPLRSLLVAPPTIAGSIVFCAATLMVLFSFACARWWSKKLFAIPPLYVHEVMSDGTERMYGQSVPPTIWDWYAVAPAKPTPPRRLRNTHK
jgi:hypothetical protein